MLNAHRLKFLVKIKRHLPGFRPRPHGKPSVSHTVVGQHPDDYNSESRNLRNGLPLDRIKSKKPHAVVKNLPCRLI